jgi:hypothetical protein
MVCGCAGIAMALFPLSERLSPKTTSELYRPAVAGSADYGGAEGEDCVVGQPYPDRCHSRSVSFYELYEVAVNFASMFTKLKSRIYRALDHCRRHLCS